MKNTKYVIISPCRNEEKFMRQTLDSVIKQSIQPALWVIVDDGSTDSTPDILAEYEANNSFISIVRRTNRGHRSVGPGVIEAFYEGFATIKLQEFDYICKLDLDLIVPPQYFEQLMLRMENNPRLGNCSGKPYYIDQTTQELISEYCGDENAIGASKFYRVACFKQIGGFVRQVMWDGIDGHRCRMLGWIACSWDEPELRFIHLRPMGSSHKGILTGRMRHGFGQYYMGTSFFYMTISSLYRMLRPPYMLGGLAMWWGYVRSFLIREERLSDPPFQSFLRKYQWSCLVKGKNKATQSINEQQVRYWNNNAKSPYSSTIN
ncbi:MAG: biofilm PGA synthesis N-glycosyltransferase PgaC [Desulforhopalus sp.]|jgi:biofilm PGA synthesis N-glycosyltransferase PgaC